MKVQETAEAALPPRGSRVPAKRIKWSRRFYALLVILFILLIIGLIGWFYWWKPQ